MYVFILANGLNKENLKGDDRQSLRRAPFRVSGQHASHSFQACADLPSLPIKRKIFRFFGIISCSLDSRAGAVKCRGPLTPREARFGATGALYSDHA